MPPLAQGQTNQSFPEHVWFFDLGTPELQKTLGQKTLRDPFFRHRSGPSEARKGGRNNAEPGTAGGTPRTDPSGPAPVYN